MRFMARFVTHPPPVVSNSWAYDWQTLIGATIAAFVAAVAALVTVTLIARQLRAQRLQNDLLAQQITADRERDRRAREGRLRGARVAFPAVLSELMAHAHLVALQLSRLSPEAWKVIEPGEYKDRYQLRMSECAVTADVPSFPDRFIAPLQAIAEYTDDAAVIDRIASIFREAQVLDARTSALIVRTRVRADYLVEMVLEALSLSARAASLMDFARGGSETADADLWSFVDAARLQAHIRWQLVPEKIVDEKARGERPGSGDDLGL